MTTWVFNDLKYTEYLLGDAPRAKVKDIWPDVRKTVIYDELKGWGIDVAKLPMEAKAIPGMQAIGIKEGMIGIGPDLRQAYPSDEATYVALVHELAHLLQFVQGLHAIEDIPESVTARDWIESPIERDAVRWSAKQAIAMGWSKRRFEELLRTRYAHAPVKLLPSLLMAGTREFSPRTAGVVPLFRRPVHVHPYRRRR